LRTIECSWLEIISSRSTTLYRAHSILGISAKDLYREDVDQLNDVRRRVRNDIKLQASSIISYEQHSIATPEDLTRLWWGYYEKGHEDHDTPNDDKARAGRPSASTPAATSGNMDYRHVVVGGERSSRKNDKTFTRPNIVVTKVKSKLGNTCANVYTQGKWTRVAPMTSKQMQESP
jgi:hypothetical protein